MVSPLKTHLLFPQCKNGYGKNDISCVFFLFQKLLKGETRSNYIYFP